MKGPLCKLLCINWSCHLASRLLKLFIMLLQIQLHISLLLFAVIVVAVVGAAVLIVIVLVILLLLLCYYCKTKSAEKRQNSGM